MLDLNTPCREPFRSPRGRWWQALCVSLVGHSCVAMVLFQGFQVGSGSPIPTSSSTVEVHFQEPLMPSLPESKPSLKSKKGKQQKKEEQPLRSHTETAAIAAVSGTSSLLSDDPIPHASNLPPLYPEEAQHLGLQGTVKVKLTINGEGQVINHEILEPRTSKLFEQAVIQAVRKWRFKPHPLGKTIEFVVPPIEFKLEG
jgi:TonB family protein